MQLLLVPIVVSILVSRVARRPFLAALVEYIHLDSSL